MSKANYKVLPKVGSYNACTKTEWSFPVKKACKLVLAAALAAALLMSAAVFASAAEKPLKIAVAADLHYRPYSELTPLAQVDFSKEPIFGHANDKSMLTYEADAILAAFFKQVEASGARYLLVPGDLTEEGHWAEHRGIAKQLKDFQRRSGIKVFVVPGNHDIRTSASRGRLDLSDFLELYADLGYNRALARREGDASYTAELDDTYRLLAIDAVIYRDDASLITPELFAWIREQLSQAKADGKKVIAMTHYNTLDHFFIEGFVAGLLTIDQYRDLSATLADAGVKYAFTGHLHANDIAWTETRKGNRHFDVTTGSLLTYPNAWRQVTFSDGAVKIETKHVDKIDTSLLPKGFSKAQLDQMKKDFPAYSLGYHRAAFRSYADMIPDLTGTLADALNVSEGSNAWRVIDAVVMSLKSAVDQPLYGETGSVEALAKQAGVTLAPSDYVNLLDIAGGLYGGFYAGNENSPMGSTQMKLLGQAVNATLVNAFVPDLGPMRRLAARRIYARTPGKAFTNEFVRTLAQGILTNWSAQEDLNATLEPYGAKWDMKGNAVKNTDFAFVMNVIWQLGMIPVNAIF